MWWLNELGLVKTIGPNKDRTRFDANLSRHHHFVCTKCGLTRDFYSEELDNIQLPDAVAALGSIEQTQVEVKGICHECAKKEGISPPVFGSEKPSDKDDA
jgi:Fur family peroxide stress response transcriptional regulator